MKRERERERERDGKRIATAVTSLIAAVKEGAAFQFHFQASLKANLRHRHHGGELHWSFKY